MSIVDTMDGSSGQKDKDITYITLFFMIHIMVFFSSILHKNLE